MKKIFLGVAVAISSMTFAQEKAKESSSPVRFGLKAGLNVSTLSGSGMKAKAGFYGGVFANIPVAQDFSVQPELLYSGMGAKDSYDSSTKLNLDYLSVPVMVQYNVLPNFYLEAGPQFNFLLSAKLKDNSVSADTKDLTKGFDFGVGIGAGYYFTPNIGASVRYVAGVSDIAKNRPSGTDSAKNGAFQVGLAYKF